MIFNRERMSNEWSISCAESPALVVIVQLASSEKGVRKTSLI